jgi:hypothetical protein
METGVSCVSRRQVYINSTPAFFFLHNTAFAFFQKCCTHFYGNPLPQSKIQLSDKLLRHQLPRPKTILLWVSPWRTPPNTTISPPDQKSVSLTFKNSPLYPKHPIYHASPGPLLRCACLTTTSTRRLLISPATISAVATLRCVPAW